MPTNSYLPFATSAGATVLTGSAYAALPARNTGFQAGIADPAQLNTVWRQSSVVASALGQFIVDYGGVDAPDDGSVSNFEANFRLALAAALAGARYGQDTSATANAMTVALSPAPPSLSSFQVVWVKVANTNTGPTTLVLNAFGSKPVTRRDGTPLQAGDIVSGQIYEFVYDPILGQFALGALAQGEVPRITATPTLYVRTDGNDSNDGSANTSTKAFATIGAAAAKGASTFYLGGKTLRIQLGNLGTYTAPTNLPATNGTLLIVGDAANPSGYIITGSGASVIGATSGVVVTLQGVTIQGTGTATNLVAANTGGSVSLLNTQFITTVATTGAHCFAGGGGSVNIGTGCIIAGFAGFMFQASGGNVTLAAPLTLQGTPTFSSATAFASTNGTILIGNSATISGSANGQRYIANSNGVINTAGGGANFFPGSTAGTTATGGQYL